MHDSYTLHYQTGGAFSGGLLIFFFKALARLIPLPAFSLYSHAALVKFSLSCFKWTLEAKTKRNWRLLLLEILGFLVSQEELMCHTTLWLTITFPFSHLPLYERTIVLPLKCWRDSGRITRWAGEAEAASRWDTKCTVTYAWRQEKTHFDAYMWNGWGNVCARVEEGGPTYSSVWLLERGTPGEKRGKLGKISLMFLPSKGVGLRKDAQRREKNR